ncbi:MAG: acyltransferase [Bacteroidota bacterium]
MDISNKIKSNPRLKDFAMWMIFGDGKPRWWVVNILNKFFHKKGFKSVIRKHARLDVIPWRTFSVGKNTIIEDFSCINNQVGHIYIGDNCTIGLSNIIIGPVKIGNNVIIAQHVCISGLNHGYEDVSVPIRDQLCQKQEIIIEDDCWIGANSVILLGTTIGRHSIVAAGSVVTKDVAPFTIVAGNPAKAIKFYNAVTYKWEKN